MKNKFEDPTEGSENPTGAGYEGLAEKHGTKEGRLSEEEALKEADMMRAFLRPGETEPLSRLLDNTLMKKKMSERSFTAEDYEQAQKAVVELKRLAKEEPTAEKMFYAFNRIINGVEQKVSLILFVLLDPFYLMYKVFLGKRAEDEKHLLPESLIDIHDRFYDALNEVLSDANEKLVKAEQAGWGYAKMELREQKQEEGEAAREALLKVADELGLEVMPDSVPKLYPDVLSVRGKKGKEVLITFSGRSGSGTLYATRKIPGVKMREREWPQEVFQDRPGPWKFVIER